MTSTATVAPSRGLARLSQRLESALTALAGKRFLPVLILLAGLLPSAWLLYELRDTPQFGLFSDDVMYIGAAESLAHNATYRESALPGDPWQTKYPPGYPLMLAAILKWNPAARNFWIMVHSWVWIAVASFALAWAMRQASLTPVQAAIVGALWAANPFGANAAVMAFAEAPFCAVLFLALGLAQRLDKAATWKAVLVGLLMGISCLIRSAGIFAIFGLVVWLLWRRSLKTAFWFGISASILPAIWMLWSHAHMPATSGLVAQYYFDYGARWLQDVRHAGLGSILVMNVSFSVKSVGEWLIPASISPLLPVLYTILLGFGCAVLADWAGGPITAVALATMGFQVFWNWPPSERFFLPVAPAFLGAGMALLSSRPAFLRIFTLVIVASADIYGIADLAGKYGTERYTGFPPVYSFIKTELPADAVILGDDRVWLFTGRKAVGMLAPMEYFYRKRPDSELTFFMGYKDVARQFGAGYLLAAPEVRWDATFDREEQLSTAIRADPDLERIFSQNGVELFRIRTNPPGSLGSAAP